MPCDRGRIHMSSPVKLLFVADIVGQPGLHLLNTILPGLIDKYKTHFVIANAENAHQGRGINRQIVQSLYDSGVNVITGGNHSFDKWKIFPYMKKDPYLLRPLNFPKGVPGFGYCLTKIPGTERQIAVINLQGRAFMADIDDPFSTAEWIVEKLREETSLIIVDFHAEATAEKMALAWELDSRVSLLIGTHTHVPTNDAQILPGGTGYITDAGMTGPFDSVIGMDKKSSIIRFTRSLPQKFKVASDDNRLCGVYAEIDAESGKCIHIEPVVYPSFKSSTKKQ